MWLSVNGAGLYIRRLRVQIPLGPLSSSCFSEDYNLTPRSCLNIANWSSIWKWKWKFWQNFTRENRIIFGTSLGTWEAKWGYEWKASLFVYSAYFTLPDAFQDLVGMKAKHELCHEQYQSWITISILRAGFFFVERAWKIREKKRGSGFKKAAFLHRLLY